VTEEIRRSVKQRPPNKLSGRRLSGSIRAALIPLTKVTEITGESEVGEASEPCRSIRTLAATALAAAPAVRGGRRGG
jgi:hypothetical protein